MVFRCSPQTASCSICIPHTTRQSPRAACRASTRVSTSPGRFPFVTCLHVTGNRAAVGGVGQNSAMIMTVVDNGPTGIDTVQRAVAPFAIAPNCASASFANQIPVGTDSEGFIVIDAP